MLVGNAFAMLLLTLDLMLLAATCHWETQQKQRCRQSATHTIQERESGVKMNDAATPTWHHEKHDGYEHWSVSATGWAALVASPNESADGIRLRIERLDDSYTVVASRTKREGWISLILDDDGHTRLAERLSDAERVQGLIRLSKDWVGDLIDCEEWNMARQCELVANDAIYRRGLESIDRSSGDVPDLATLVAQISEQLRSSVAANRQALSSRHVQM